MATEMSNESWRPDEASQGPGILVVDDEPNILNLLHRYLELHGFRPYLAASGPEAVALYRREGENIDVALLDVRMPGMDGPATLSALRALDPQVPCCFMSADIGDYRVEELFQMGARRLFDKPLNLSALAEGLKQLAGCPAL